MTFTKLVFRIRFSFSEKKDMNSRLIMIQILVTTVPDYRLI